MEAGFPPLFSNPPSMRITGIYYRNILENDDIFVVFVAILTSLFCLFYSFLT